MNLGQALTIEDGVLRYREGEERPTLCALALELLRVPDREIDALRVAAAAAASAARRVIRGMRDGSAASVGLAYLKATGEHLTVEELASKIGFKRKVVAVSLYKMVNDGLVDESSGRPRKFWAVRGEA